MPLFLKFIIFLNIHSYNTITLRSSFTIRRGPSSWILIASSLSKGASMGCRAEIRTRACLTASRRTTNWAAPHPNWAAPHPLSCAASYWAAPHPEWAAPHPSLFYLFLDPGSDIRDPGWVKIRIRDKHPGSATLDKTPKSITSNAQYILHLLPLSHVGPCSDPSV